MGSCAFIKLFGLDVVRFSTHYQVINREDGEKKEEEESGNYSLLFDESSKHNTTQQGCSFLKFQNRGTLMSTSKFLITRVASDG